MKSQMYRRSLLGAMAVGLLGLLLANCGAFRRNISPAHPQATAREQLIADFYTIHTQGVIILTELRRATRCAADPQGVDCNPAFANDPPGLTPAQFAAVDDRFDDAQARLEEALKVFEGFEAGGDPQTALILLGSGLGMVINSGLSVQESLKLVLPGVVASALALLELQRQRVEAAAGER